MSNCNGICYLCLSNCNNSFSLDSKLASNRTFQEFISQHFWFPFHESVEKTSEIVCVDCFHKIEDFDEFYALIHEIHFPEIGHNLAYNVHISIIQQNDIESKLTDNLERKNPSSNIQPCDKKLEENEYLRYKNKFRKTTCDENLSIQSEEIFTSDTILVKSRRNKRCMERTKGITEKLQGNPDKCLNIKKPKLNEKSKCYQEMFDNEKEKLALWFSFHCELCSLPLESLIHSRAHYKSEHNSKGYLVCCNRKFYKYKHIFEHLEWHDNPDAFMCSICKKTYMDGLCLKKHFSETHTQNNGGPHKCVHCNKIFSRKNSYNLHMRSFHPQQKNMYNCTECKKSYAVESRLNCHIKKAHTDTHMCDICAKTFKSKQSYELHFAVVHTNENKRVQCDLCGSWLKHLTYLKTHMLRQHPNKPKELSTCKDCNKCFKSKGLLSRHIRNVHSSIFFTCHDCGKQFKCQKSLKEHVAIHMGITDLYTCTFCPKTFRSSSNMCSHRRRDHPVEYELLKMNGYNHQSS